MDAKVKGSRSRQLRTFLLLFLKFLPEAFSHDTERVARFQREASRCLDRNPASRLRDIGEARVAIDNARKETITLACHPIADRSVSSLEAS